MKSIRIEDVLYLASEFRWKLKKVRKDRSESGEVIFEVGDGVIATLKKRGMVWIWNVRKEHLVHGKYEEISSLLELTVSMIEKDLSWDAFRVVLILNELIEEIKRISSRGGS